ncbi:MAG: hypothetical protein PHI41_10400 [Erysipelotrichaceae bacterium]|nr:hypothetical protein [Erysipelotrichaceae bacterium]
MKKKVMAIILVVLIVGAGVLSLNRPDSNQATTLKLGWYTTDDIVAEILANGVSLHHEDDLDPGEYQIWGIEPAIYDINGSDDNLFIYIFANMIDRNESGYHFVTGQLDSISITQTLQSRNAVILQTGDTAEDSIFKAVTYDLNEGHTRVYESFNDNWQVVCILEYYANEIAGKTGETYDDQYLRATYGIRYVGDEGHLVDDEIVNVEVDTFTGSIKALLEVGNLIDNDYYIFGRHSEYRINNLDNNITCKVTWNGNEETMAMTYE